MIKCFERSTVQRIEDNSNEVCDNANKYTEIRRNTAMAKRGTKSWEREETILRKDDSSAGLISPWKKEGKKGKKTNYYYTGDSNLVNHPCSKPRRARLNFVERAKHVPCGIVTLRRMRFLKLLSGVKRHQKEKNL